MTSVQALDAKTIVVNYSEKVDPVTALAPANYTLYSTQTGNPIALEASTGTNIAKIQASFAFTDSTQKSVKITITNVGNGTAIAGYPMGGLSNGNYMLYVTGTKDIAANTIIDNSNVTFAGTTTPDTTAPALVSSTFNSASGAVTLTFDKPTTGAAPADDKVSFQVGSNTVSLKNATDFTGITGTSTASFTVPAATLAKINALGANPQIVLADSAFTDGTNATVAATSTPTIAAGPVLNSVTYDENTNTVVYKFSKTIDVTKITAFDNNFVLGGVNITGAKFNNTANSTDLSFTLSDANAQAVETALRGGTLTASVAQNTVQDTDATPNKNAAASSSATLVAGTTYTKDTTAPTVTGAVYNGDTGVLAITFNEAVRNTATDYALANIQLYQDDNTVAGLQTTVSGTTAADAQVATLNVPAATKPAIVQGDLVDATGAPAVLGSESKTIYIKNADLKTTLDAVPAADDIYVNVVAGAVKDANTNVTTAVESQKVTKVAVSNSSAITGATSINTAPNLAKSDTLGQITVNFANGNGAVAVDPTTAANPANYNIYLSTNPLSKPQISSVSLTNNNTSAVILFSSPVTSGSVYGITTSGIKTVSGAVADLTSTLNDGNPYTFTGTDGAAPSANQTLALTDKDSSGTVTAGDTMAITFSAPIVLPSGFDASQITVNNNHSLGTSTLALSADQKTLTITAGSGATIAAGDTLAFPATVKGYDGQALTNATTLGLTVAGNVAPTIKSAVYTDTNADGKVNAGDTLVVTFDQNVTAAEGATLTGDFKLNTDAAKVSNVALNGATATLTLKDGADLTGGPVTITAAQPDIKNVWGSAAVDATGKAVTYSDNTAPTVTGISYKGHALTFTFSEAVNDLTKTNANDLAAALEGKLAVNGGSLGAAYTAATLSNDGKSVTITLDGTEALDQYSTISIAAGVFGTATNELKDASGNVAVRAQGTPYALTITQ